MVFRYNYDSQRGNYMKIYGVIMAGGGGTRFWPLSRKSTPKQFLNLSGKDCMVNEAIDRLAQIVKYEDIFVVTNQSQAEMMQKVTDGRISRTHILAEPAARNTSACIGYAAMEIIKKYGDGIMVITPSDAYIRNNEKFASVLQNAVSAAEQEDALVTVGIEPTFPSTGYGYIKFEDTEGSVEKKVCEFKEKPDLETAKDYLADGQYVWNSGMFVWKASTILNEFKKYLPDIYEQLQEIGNSMRTKLEQEVIERIYPELQSISIDYGIMEKAENVLVVPGEFGWSDVGSWDMMGTLHNADGNGNVSVGDTLLIDTENTIAYSKERLIAALGVKNLILVETPDALLVCDKQRAQDVKGIVDILRKQGREDLL